MDKHKSLNLENMEQVLDSDVEDGEEIGQRSDEVKVDNADNVVYNCKSCDMTFFSVDQHVREFHQNEEIVVEVEEEVADNYGFEEVIEHEEDIADDSSCFECQICCTVLKSGRSLKLHMRAHDAKADKDGANNELKHLCKLCNRGFSNDEHLRLHLLAHDKTQLVDYDGGGEEKGGSGYPCNYCGKRFKRPFEKVKHERIHTGERPFSCDICGKRFRVSSCLKLHLRTHDDSRPFVCPHCKKRFKVQSAYNHHLKIHSNERNYHCSYCSKSFKTAVHLNGHQKSHTKPFSCSECNRPFGSLYSVRKHMQVHQQADNKLSYSCDICGANYARAFALRDHRKQQHGADDDEQFAEHADDPGEDDATIESEIVMEEPFELKVESEETIEEDLLF